MPTPTEVDRDAPVIAEHQIDVGAPAMQALLDQSLTSWLQRLRATAEAG